jgi:formin 2
LNVKKRFLGDKRSQSVGIILAKLPPIKKIEEALNNIDNSILNRGQISSLLKEYVTQEELCEYDNLNEEGAIFEKQDDFLISLHKIPFSQLKLTIWNFTLEYIENFESVESTNKNVKGACDEIKNDEYLPILFSYVLTIGNILNGGTPKGQADGFNLDILPKLTGLKDNQNKTMIQVICSMIKKENENFENVKKNFTHLNQAAKMVMSETQGGINKLKKELKDQKANLAKISSLNDQFVKKCTEFVETCTSDLEKAEKEFTSNITYFQEVVSFYGYTQADTKYKNPEEFFILINDFLNDVDKSIPKTEPKKVFNRKHEVGKKIMDKSENMDNLLKELKSRTNA